MMGAVYFAYGCCTRSTSSSQPFSSQLIKIKAMLKLLWPLLIVNFGIPDLI